MTTSPALPARSSPWHAALRAQRWNLKLAARELNVSRTTLYALVDACPRVRKASELSREEIEQCAERCGGNVDAMVDELEVSGRGLLLRMKELGLDRRFMG